MKQSFLDFVAARKANAENVKSLNEAFKEEDMDKALDLISKVLSKHIDGLIPIEGYVDVECGSKKCTAKQFLVLDKKDPYHSSAFQFNWLNSAKSSEVYSIDFFKDSLNAKLPEKLFPEAVCYISGAMSLRRLPLSA